MYIFDIQYNKVLSLGKNNPMPKGKSSKLTFKTYNPNQAFLLPPSLDDLIADGHMVRVVSQTIDQLNIEPLLKTYKGGGASIFHPKMMIKVLVYAYLNGIYSSRKIAKALREDIHFMWLSGMNRPDYRTIILFRSSRLKPVIDKVFGSMVIFCQEQGYIKLENYFIDGTKMEADASKTSYVWAKNVKRHKASTEEKIRELLHHIDQINEAENFEYGDKDLEELGQNATISSEKIKEQVKKINEQLSEKENDIGLSQTDKKVAKVVKQIVKERLPKLEQYEQQQKELSGRNSYSKTDIDATFHRLKNGLLRPSYNTLLGCENQFIINYTIHQNPGESGLLIEHLKKLKKQIGALPENIISDSAFGTEENYSYLEKERIGNYLKYNTFHFEQTKTYKENPFSKDKFAYSQSSDTYQCPGNKTLHFKGVRETKTDNGYVGHVKIYECEDCHGCPFAAQCKKAKGNRTLQVNPQLDQYRAQAYENLTSPTGLKLRKQRNIEPETVFGDIKWNQHYDRFKLRGKDKVNIEWGLLSIAHNVKKIYQVNVDRKANASGKSIEFIKQQTTVDHFYFFSELVA
jgi:transposase